jgi:uncharacterized membrane protein YkgB
LGKSSWRCWIDRTQKWFDYEAQVLIPYISNGPLISWLYPVFGIGGASWFLVVAEWTFGALLFLGFWNKKLGALGAAGLSLHLSAPSPSFLSCRMAGQHPRADSLRWWAMSPS